MLNPFNLCAMETTATKDFLQGLETLWQESRNRELLFVGLMKKDCLGQLRKHCLRGHISSLLFQKDIGWIYDSFKSNLIDFKLGEHPLNTLNRDITESLMADAGDFETVMILLKSTEFHTIQSYRKVLQLVDHEGEVHEILLNHLDLFTQLRDDLVDLQTSCSGVTPRYNYQSGQMI